MITYEGQLIWRSFAAMLNANALIIAVGGFAAKTWASLAGPKLIPYLGIVLCICWCLVTIDSVATINIGLLG